MSTHENIHTPSEDTQPYRQNFCGYFWVFVFWIDYIQYQFLSSVNVFKIVAFFSICRGKQCGYSKIKNLSKCMESTFSQGQCVVSFRQPKHLVNVRGRLCLSLSKGDGWLQLWRHTGSSQFASLHKGLSTFCTGHEHWHWIQIVRCGMVQCGCNSQNIGPRDIQHTKPDGGRAPLSITLCVSPSVNSVLPLKASL